MPSLLPSFEYDIFISYRQNDNRSGWVTDFVNALQEELAATIKEPLSIYFDKNPHDGLLETHNVDKSLEGKLKCLIFIPILSQTYCDPKSFAWQHEFCAFNRMCNDDAPLSSGEGSGVRSIGRDIKLSNGNVASRILPIKIHELDAEDKAIIENEIGGVLRAIEFIFKSPGVNRPLRATEEHPQDNLNKTFYRDQINKVANAIKEIIIAIKNPQPSPTTTYPISTAKTKPSTKKVLLGIVTLLVIAATYFAYQQLSRLAVGQATNNQQSVDKSIAVLPFSNLSEDKNQEYFTEGMVEEIINQLVKVRDLNVISRTSSKAFKNSTLTLREIASKLGTAHVVEGSVSKTGNKIRITVQLIEASTDNHLWSETYDRDLTDVFVIQTEISKNIARELKAIISPSELKQIENIPTGNQLAYDFYLKALQSASDNPSAGNPEPIQLYTEAIKADPNFALAYIQRSRRYALWFYNRVPGWEEKLDLAQKDFDQGKLLAGETIESRLLEVRLLHNARRYREAIKVGEKLQDEYPNNADIFYQMALSQRRVGMWELAKRNLAKAISLDPGNHENYYEMARLCLVTRDFRQGYDYCSAGSDEGFKTLKESLLLRLTGNPREAYSTSVNKRNKYLFNREFDSLIVLSNSSALEVRESATIYFPKALDFAHAHYWKEDKERAKHYAWEAIQFLEKKLKESPGDERIYAALSYAYAYTGKTREAISYINKTIDMAPIQSDAFELGPFYEEQRVYVYIICGEYDLAMDKIEWLLTVPGYLSSAILKTSPRFDPLRNLPRFQKILNTEYITKL